MKIIFILIACIVLAIFAVASNAKKRNPAAVGKGRPYPYRGRKTLCTPAEARFFEKLMKALPEHYIFAQVQISRMVDVTDREKGKAWLNRIDRKSVDFVVCDRNHQIVAAVELDDATHTQRNRQERDEFVEAVFKDAGIRLARFHAREAVAAAVIKSRVLGIPVPVFIPVPDSVSLPS